MQERLTKETPSKEKPSQESQSGEPLRDVLDVPNDDSRQVDEDWVDCAPTGGAPIPADATLDICCCHQVPETRCKILEWTMSNLGSVLFVVGSFFFWPPVTSSQRPGRIVDNHTVTYAPDWVPGENLTDLRLGAWMFLIGSVLFFIVSIFIYLRNQAHRCLDIGLFVHIYK